MKIDRKKYKFDKVLGNRPIRFIERFCKFTSGPKEGQAVKLEKFQKDMIINANGWKHKSNDRLKHRYVWFEVPKGNGKTALISLVALYKCCAEGIKNGEIYVAAGDREQARILHNDCKNVIEASPELAGKFVILKDSIVHKKSGSFIKVLSAEAYTKHGFRPYCIIFDELHVQPNRELWDTLTKGLMKIPNSQCYVITTAGYPNTFYETQHNYAEALIKGTLVDDTWLPIIYKAKLPKDKKKAEKYIWTKKAWKEANPGLGTIIDPFDFETLAASAKNIPSERDAFKRLHLNIITQEANTWDVVEYWHKNNTGPINKQELSGLACFGGLDLASTRDLSSCVLKFPSTGDILARFWIPEETVIKKTLTENINYQAWVDAGFITVTPGNVQDYDKILEDILEDAELFDIQSIGFDRYNSSQLVNNLIKKGVNMNPFGQGFVSMNTPTKTVEKNLLSLKYNHGGNPVMTWQIGNVVLDQNPAGDVKPNKAKSKNKIDGIVAFIMAEGEYLTSLADHPGELAEDFEFTIV